MNLEIKSSPLRRIVFNASLMLTLFTFGAISGSSQVASAALQQTTTVAPQQGAQEAPYGSEAWRVQRALTQEQMAERVIREDLPYGSDTWRVQKLSESPRRREMVKLPGTNRTLQAFVVYPATKEKVPVVMMVPEDQGLNDWAKAMADEVAMMGYIVVVPDLLAGHGPNGGGRDSFPDTKSALMAHFLLTEQIMTADMNAWADWSEKLEQCNSKIAVMGFGWGGGRAFQFATQRKKLDAVYIFYDAAPSLKALAGLTAPVYGFYAEIDSRVIKSLDGTKAAMAELGKKYEPVVYLGAEHMFVRLGEMPGNTNPANTEARYMAMARLQQLLKAM